MVIYTKSERVIRTRRTILEMLNASVDLSQSQVLVEQMEEYSANPDRFIGTNMRSSEVLDDNPCYIRDYSKCILCWRCVQACGDDMQFTYSLSIGGRGYESRIATFYDAMMPETTCVFCGNCVGVCPTNALQDKTEYLLQQGIEYYDIRKMRNQNLGKRSSWRTPNE